MIMHNQAHTIGSKYINNPISKITPQQEKYGYIKAIKVEWVKNEPCWVKIIHGPVIKSQDRSRELVNMFKRAINVE